MEPVEIPENVSYESLFEVLNSRPLRGLSHDDIVYVVNLLEQLLELDCQLKIAIRQRLQ